MKLSSLLIDNITELLVKILEFTHTRQKVLTENINSVNVSGFVPKDLAINEFSDSLNQAISEHAQNQRLILRDTKNVKFGTSGNFEVKSVPDKYAKELLEGNRDEYLELQVNKLLENSLNQRVAAELLRKKQGMVSIFK